MKNPGTRIDGKEKGNIGGNIVLPPINIPTYEELDITKMEAARWKKLTNIPVKIYHTGSAVDG